MLMPAHGRKSTRNTETNMLRPEIKAAAVLLPVGLGFKGVGDGEGEWIGGGAGGMLYTPWRIIGAAAKAEEIKWNINMRRW